MSGQAIVSGAADPGPLPADLKGRRAVVTGAAGGIGLAIANRLAMAEALIVNNVGIGTEHGWCC